MKQNLFSFLSQSTPIFIYGRLFKGNMHYPVLLNGSMDSQISNNVITLTQDVITSMEAYCMSELIMFDYVVNNYDRFDKELLIDTALLFDTNSKYSKYKITDKQSIMYVKSFIFVSEYDKLVHELMSLPNNRMQFNISSLENMEEYVKLLQEYPSSIEFEQSITDVYKALITDIFDNNKDLLEYFAINEPDTSVSIIDRAYNKYLNMKYGNTTLDSNTVSFDNLEQTCITVMNMLINQLYVMLRDDDTDVFNMSKFDDEFDEVKSKLINNDDYDSVNDITDKYNQLKTSGEYVNKLHKLFMDSTGKSFIQFEIVRQPKQFMQYDVSCKLSRMLFNIALYETYTENISKYEQSAYCQMINDSMSAMVDDDNINSKLNICVNNLCSKLGINDIQQSASVEYVVKYVLLKLMLYLSTNQALSASTTTDLVGMFICNDIDNVIDTLISIDIKESMICTNIIDVIKVDNLSNNDIYELNGSMVSYKRFNTFKRYIKQCFNDIKDILSIDIIREMVDNLKSNKDSKGMMNYNVIFNTYASYYSELANDMGITANAIVIDKDTMSELDSKLREQILKVVMYETMRQDKELFDAINNHEFDFEEVIDALNEIIGTEDVFNTTNVNDLFKYINTNINQEVYNSLSTHNKVKLYSTAVSIYTMITDQMQVILGDKVDESPLYQMVNAFKSAFKSLIDDIRNDDNVMFD